MSTEPVVKVVATAMSLVVGLSDNMQITFQSGFEGDETDDAVNARLDRLVMFAQRQRAIAEVPAIEKDLFEERRTLAQLQEDLERVNLQHDKAQAQRAVEIDERIHQRGSERKKFEAEINGVILKMQESRQETWNEGSREHLSRGRSGAYSPAGHVKVNMERIDKEIEKAKDNREKALEDFDRVYDEGIATARAEIEKADAERDQVIQNMDVSIKRFTAAIAANEERLAAARDKAGG